MYYLSMDGGGSKLLGVLFDGDYRPVAHARAPGTHTSVYRPEQIRENIAACYAALFANVPKPIAVRLYTVCGSERLYASLLPEGVTLESAHSIGESVAGLYAGSGRRSGYLALSGTGSDVFRIENDAITHFYGGWGAILGDEGSGVWMAKKAMEAAIRFEQGWGAPTRFGEAVKKHFGFEKLWDYVDYLYDTTAPFRRLAELLPLAARTAKEGDEAMEAVFRSGGELLAAQMCAMFRASPPEPRHITACGGAWKAHPVFAEAFLASVRQEYPEAELVLPRFEHVLAGPICLAMERGEDIPAVMDRLEEHFPDFVWKRG